MRLAVQFPNSFTAFGVMLLTLQVSALFLPFAKTGAESQLGLVCLAHSAQDLAGALADIVDAAARRITFEEILPFPPPNLSLLAGGAAILVCGLLVCEKTPPRWLGSLTLLALSCAFTPMHPYSHPDERVLAGGVVWFAICAVAGLSCFAAPRPAPRRRRVGPPITLTVAPQATTPMIWTRNPRLLIRT